MAGKPGRLLLVDSSIYIDLLRAGRNPADEFRSALETGALLTCGIVRLEVLRGIIDERIRAWMEGLFDEMTACPFDERLWREAAHLAWGLDRRGTVLLVPDLAIASCALRAGAVIVSRDPHFRLIQDLAVLESVPDR
ncbi:MAG: PIN domain-containing protein [Spirochaetia bacterium]|jgi:predicted nucleic acid-binding protein